MTRVFVFLFQQSKNEFRRYERSAGTQWETMNPKIT